MRNLRRGIHFDFHTMPGYKGLLKEFDADDFAEKLSVNHVDYINFTARCNIGFSYYDTEVGKKYPGLKRDILKEVLEACHKKNIGVTAYVNGGLDHEFACEHVEWCKISKDGHIYNGDKKMSNFFRMMCLNSPYRVHLYSEIKELLQYDIDGLFVDCMDIKPCYCPACIEKMQSQGIDIENDQQVIEYHKSVIREVCGEIKELIGQRDIRVNFNGLECPWDAKTHVELECLPSGAWGYDYFLPVALYYRQRKKDRVYMSGRFQFDWGDFGGIKSVVSMENDLFDALSQGYELSFGDHLHPINGLSDTVIKRIGKVFAKKLEYEKFTSESENVYDASILVNNVYDLFDNNIKGAVRMLSELKILFDIADKDSDISERKLLVVPDGVSITDYSIDKLKKFIERGGKVLFCGKNIEWAVDNGFLPYVEYCGTEPLDNSYFCLDDDSEKWSCYIPDVLIKNKGSKVDFKYISGCFSAHFDGRQSYYYRPQGNYNGYSSAVSDGRTGAICFDVFNAYCMSFLTEIKTLAGNIINSLLTGNMTDGKMIVTKGLNPSTYVSITKNSYNMVVHIKATHPEQRCGRGVIESHDINANSTISVRGEYKVFLLPENTLVNSEFVNGYTYFETGIITGYKAFSLRD